jgi:hypothetical protein
MQKKTSIISVVVSTKLGNSIKSQYEMLKLSIQCTIVVVQVGTVKIYVGAVEAPRNKERQDVTQFTTKIGGKTSFPLCKKISFSFQVTRLMSYYAETGHSRLSILILNTCASFPKQMHFLE